MPPARKRIRLPSRAHARTRENEPGSRVLLPLALIVSATVGWIRWGLWVVLFVIARLGLGVYAEWRAKRRRRSTPPPLARHRDGGASLARPPLANVYDSLSRARAPASTTAAGASAPGSDINLTRW